MNINSYSIITTSGLGPKGGPGSPNDDSGAGGSYGGSGGLSQSSSTFCPSYYASSVEQVRN